MSQESYFTDYVMLRHNESKELEYFTKAKIFYMI